MYLEEPDQILELNSLDEIPFNGMLKTVCKKYLNLFGYYNFTVLNEKDENKSIKVKVVLCK